MGIILYRLLTNTVPFEGDSLGAVFASILEDTPPAVNVLRPEVPEGLHLIVSKCLQRPREDRYQNAAELALALQPFGPPSSSHSVDRICRTLSVSTTPAQVVVPTKSPSWRPGPQAVIDVDGDSAAQGSTAAPWSANSQATTPRKITPRVMAIGGVALLSTAFIIFKLASPSASTPAVVVSPPPAVAATAIPAPVASSLPPAEPAPSASTATSAAASTTPAPSAPPAAPAPPVASAAPRPIAPKSSTSVKPAASASAVAKPPPDNALNNRN
jgi:serine/threonine protein kinase